MSTPLLQVKNLCTSFDVDAGEVRAVNGISFSLDKGKVLGIVGESGSGKSVTAYSIMRILVEPGRIKSGEILFDGQDIVKFSKKQMSEFRGKRVSIIFQDPMTSLNPTYTIGNQLREAILLHTNRNHEQANARAVEMLKLVGVNEPEKRLKQYPHELSGGMRQRVMIAMALACEPDPHCRRAHHRAGRDHSGADSGIDEGPAKEAGHGHHHDYARPGRHRRHVRRDHRDVRGAHLRARHRG